ncbi:MAG: uroporphyrinogen decarboxylase [Rhodobacteraceae bacterium]|nr:MAG: uroporphyrinogen decarboxylase [Paracoccaceae bacterium]
MTGSPKKTILRALAGETQKTPPVWMMRQAGRYLPEYRELRATAGGFLDLCYNPEFATEVTMQPIRRYGFDAAILFADILLLPQALGMDLWFAEGEGPRLNPVTCVADLSKLKGKDDIHDVLGPVYETVNRLSGELPKETALIGFAGAPWTVATYMVAGRGTPDQAPAREWMYRDPTGFGQLIDLITESTIEYLAKQVEAGAEVIKLFDSWSGALGGSCFEEYALKPAVRIATELKARFPGLPVIGFPRGAGGGYIKFADAGVFDGVAIDTSVPADWARDELQNKVTVQGNLDPMLLITGGESLERETKRLLDILGQGPYIFNLGHGITPQGDPANVEKMLRFIRG